MSVKRNIRSKVYFLTLFTALICASDKAQALQETASDALIQTATDFTEVAKKAIPAVVSIKIKSSTKPKTTNPWGGGSDEDSADLFSDDFFRRFFGLPKEEESPNNLRQAPVVSQASGFIVSSDGFVLTNSHVVADATEIMATLNDGREFVCKVIGQDPNTDIAVIKIDATNLPFLTLANSDHLKVGQWAIAIGTPLGLQASLTVGVISATGRNNLDLARIEDFIQTDAAINRGNSGGPLLNLNAQVVGMNTAIFTNMSNGGYMGIGFAIPSNMIAHVMNELISTGKVTRGFLGVIMQQMDNNLAKAFNLDKIEGVLVAEVSKDSPAEKAGIHQGDIILKYNNQQVTNIAVLRNAVALMQPGSHITLSVLRDKKLLEIPVDVGTFPSEVIKDKQEATKENKYGFSVQELTQEQLKASSDKGLKGVVIASIQPESPAAWAGLKKGTIIFAVNQKKITSVAEFNKALDSLEKGKPLLLLVKQGETVRFVSLQVN